MKIIPRLPGRGQLLVDAVFSIALLLLMAGIGLHVAMS